MSKSDLNASPDLMWPEESPHASAISKLRRREHSQLENQCNFVLQAKNWFQQPQSSAVSLQRMHCCCHQTSPCTAGLSRYFPDCSRWRFPGLFHWTLALTLMRPLHVFNGNLLLSVLRCSQNPCHFQIKQAILIGCKFGCSECSRVRKARRTKAPAKELRSLRAPLLPEQKVFL